MGTWFDRDRGVHSGRIKPTTTTPAHGEYVFVLGADEQDEPAILSSGDYTEVSQLVNLSGFDLIGANMKTIGALVGEAKRKCGFVFDPDTLFAFDFDIGVKTAKNLVDGGFEVTDIGSVQITNETYSPDRSYSKHVPAGSAEAKIAGVNTPQAFPALLSEYTVQFWMNFESNVFTIASGTNPFLFSIGRTAFTGGRIYFQMSPIAMFHRWLFVLTHGSGGVNYSVALPAFYYNQPIGWQLVTLRYKETNDPQLEMFYNTTKKSSTVATIPKPDQPAAGCDIEFASKDLVGGFDQIRMISRWMTDEEIAASYAQCVVQQASTLFKWIMQIVIDGNVYAERKIDPDEARTWTDFVAPVRILTGPHTVAFRLKLEEI